MTGRRFGRTGLAGAAILLMLARCGGSEPPETFAPLSYGYLLPLRLNVGSIEVDDSWSPPPGTSDVSSLSPVRPRDALRQMGQDRLVAAGTTGRAVLHVDDAAIRRVGDGLQGHCAVTLDIYTSGGTRTAYAQAQVSRATTDLQPALRPALYRLTRTMVDDMNVELEFQIRRSLRDWLLETGQAPSAVPAPVSQQPLSSPGSSDVLAPPPGLAPSFPAAPPPEPYGDTPAPPPAGEPAFPAGSPSPYGVPGALAPPATQSTFPAEPPAAPYAPPAGPPPPSRYIPGMPASAPLPGRPSPGDDGAPAQPTPLMPPGYRPPPPLEPQSY